MSTPPSATTTPRAPRAEPPAALGFTLERVDRYSHADIEAFAAACRDRNPLHADPARAERSRYGEIIASGQHTSSMLLGLATSFFTQPTAGRFNEVLVLHVNFAFKAPVFADEEATLRWSVAAVEWNDKLGGHIVMLDGGVRTERSQPALVARTALLVKAMTPAA